MCVCVCVCVGGWVGGGCISVYGQGWVCGGMQGVSSDSILRKGIPVSNGPG